MSDILTLTVPGEPSPDDRTAVRHSEERIASSDGLELHVRRYQGVHTTGLERTLMIVHGLSEHCGRYEHVAELVAPLGWNVLVTDLRGHGRSGGVPTHVTHFDQYLQDLELVHRHYGLVPENTAMLGHSMGGLIAARFAQLHQDRIAALVLLSPLLGVAVRVPNITIGMGKVMSVVAPRTRFRSRVRPSDTTCNPAAIAFRASDPYQHNSVTAGWFFAMQGALQTVWQDAPKLRLPLLIVQAGEDRIVDPKAPKPWLESTSSLDKTFRLMPNSLHELLNEPEWAETLRWVIRWLDRRVGPHPARVEQSIA